VAPRKTRKIQAASSNLDGQDVASNRRRQLFRWSLIAVGIILVGILSYYFIPQRQCPIVRDGGDEPKLSHRFSTVAMTLEQSGYVGPDACATCHQERFKEFRQTKHYRTSRMADAGDMKDQLIDGKNKYLTRNSNLWFQISAQNEKLTLTAFEKTPDGQRRRSEQLAIAFGAGGVDEIYGYWRENQLYELPVAYLNPIEQWGNAPGFMDGTVNFERAIVPRCLECHGTFFEHVLGTRNQYNTENFILGVTCERCHGPGRRHVEFHQEHPDESDSRFISTPTSYTRQRELDICAQCHSNALRRRGPAFSYRPGQPLDVSYRMDLKTHLEDQPTANQNGQLAQSSCFRESKTMTCTTCHDPHVLEDKDHELAAVRSCYGCHQPDHCNQRSSLPVAVRNHCIDCHMPVRQVTNITFDIATDEYVPLMQRHNHRIAVYSDATKGVLLEWLRSQTDDASKEQADRLASELFELRLAEADELRLNHRLRASSGAYRDALRLLPTHVTREKLSQVLATKRTIDFKLRSARIAMKQKLFSAAIEYLREAIELKPDHANAHVLLGKLLTNSGEADAGIKHLQAVAQYDPDIPEGYYFMGVYHFRQGRPDLAIDNFRLAEQIDSYNAKINLKMGRAHAMLTQYDAAVARFHRALEIKPDYVEACRDLSIVLHMQGKSDQAIDAGLRATQMTDVRDPAFMLALSETYAADGRFDDALNTARQALALAEKSDPSLAGQIRIRLDHFQKDQRNGSYFQLNDKP